MIKKINLKYLIIIWVLIIFILSSISGNELKKIPQFKIPHLDKIVHFIMYFILQSLLVLEYYKELKNKFNPKKFISISLILSVIYGAIIEVLQEFFFINRSGNIYDFIANSTGALASILIITYLIKTNIIKLNK